MLLVEQRHEMFIRRPNGNNSVSSDPGERYIRVPEHGLSNSSSYEMSATSGQSSPSQPNVAAGGYPSVFPLLSEVTYPKDVGHDSGESYIRLEDCYSGHPASASSTLPASCGGQTMSPNKSHVQAGASINRDAADHFGDSALPRVEYCNEFELGEHDFSMIVSVKSSRKDAKGVNKCNDGDYDNDDYDYCRYKYPTVRYNVHHSMLSQPTEPRSVASADSRYWEPLYVNCSYLVNLNWNARREFWPQVKRHGICCESVLPVPSPRSKLPELFCEQASSGHVSVPNSEPTYSSDSGNSWGLYPDHDVSSISQPCATAGDDDDAHNYVNIPQWQSSEPFCSPVSAAFTSSSKHRNVEETWRK